MKRPRLGVNIDHVATIRNARGESYPSPLRAALVVQESGADSVTIHLREDRRHIRDYDLQNIKKRLKIPLNLEMAPTKEMLKVALKHKPNFACIVPEKRAEITTEGGLNLKKRNLFLKRIIKDLKKKGIRVSLFIEPKISDVFIAKKIGANCVELHTGKYCNLLNSKKNTKSAFNNLKNAIYYGNKIGLEVHVGHGLTYNSVSKISKINFISEFNIGHFIISESLFCGLKKVIRLIKKILNK